MSNAKTLDVSTGVPGTLGVIIPLFNEVNTIGELLEKVLAQSCVSEAIVVDDGSSDGSSDVVDICTSRDPRVKLFQHPMNRGKGAAIKTGISNSVSSILVIQDADMEYDPTDLNAMLALIMNGKAEVVYGSRFAQGARSQTTTPHMILNRMLTILTNWITGLKLTDEATCYRMFKRRVVGQMQLKEDRFGFCPEFTAKVSGLGTSIAEIPISYIARGRGEGKKASLARWDISSQVLAPVWINSSAHLATSRTRQGSCAKKSVGMNNSSLVKNPHRGIHIERHFLSRKVLNK